MIGVSDYRGYRLEIVAQEVIVPGMTRDCRVGLSKAAAACQIANREIYLGFSGQTYLGELGLKEG